MIKKRHNLKEEMFVFTQFVELSVHSQLALKLSSMTEGHGTGRKGSWQQEGGNDQGWRKGDIFLHAMSPVIHLLPPGLTSYQASPPNKHHLPASRLAINSSVD